MGFISVAFFLITIFLFGCGGSIEATSDMTLSVAPSSIDFKDASNTQSKSIENFQVSVLASDSKPAVDVKVYASLDSYWVNSNIVWFPDCQGNTTCSCVTDKSGRCTIRVAFVHGGGKIYNTDILFYSGPLSQTVTISVTTQ